MGGGGGMWAERTQRHGHSGDEGERERREKEWSNRSTFERCA